MNMPTQPEGPGLADYGLLLLLAALWGSSFMFIKLAVATVPAVSMTALRLVLAAAFMYLLARALGEDLPRSGRIWGVIVLAALIGNALPFTLIGWGQERIDAGLSAILMGAMPLTTAVLAHILTVDEKLSVRRAAGVVLGFSGLVVLIGPEQLERLGDHTIRQLAVLAAACCYGLNAVITRHLIGLPRNGLAAAVLLAAAAMMVPACLLAEAPWTLRPSAVSLTAIVVLAVLHTAFGQLVLFALIRRQGASFFSQINFLVPLFGVLWGALVLGERPSPNAYAALALILAGLAVARRQPVIAGVSGETTEKKG
jgi:drug/metabolite transporter (DMT)-like permease